MRRGEEANAYPPRAASQNTLPNQTVLVTTNSAPIVQSWQDNGLFQDTKFILPSAPAIPVTSVSLVS